MPVKPRELVSAVLDAVDANDPAAFADHLAPQAVFRFGNAPPVQGVDAVRTAVEGFLAGIRAIAHEVEDVLADGERIAAHGRVTYTRLDGSTLSVPFALIWYLRSGLIADYRIFADLSGL